MSYIEKIFYSAILIWLFAIKSSFAMEYTCPELPLKLKIGQKLKSGWLMTYNQDKNINIANLFYQKYFGIEYKFKKWSSLKGVNKTENSMAIIKCCSFFKKHNKVFCLTKTIKNSQCQSQLFNKNKYSFICTKQA